MDNHSKENEARIYGYLTKIRWENMCHASTSIGEVKLVVAYAMLNHLVNDLGGLDEDGAWRSFLHDALDEVVRG